jgi:hypothetical protein
MGLKQRRDDKETGKDALEGKLAFQVSIFFKKQKPHQ